MLSVKDCVELANHIGTEIGPGNWITVTQEMIDGFAAVTGDRQWIHLDTERAAAESPGGRTIAHGYLLTSLLTRLADDLLIVRAKTRSINYGSNRVRFTAMVPSGSRVRLRQFVEQVEPEARGVRLVTRNTLELEHSDRPALIAECIRLILE